MNKFAHLDDGFRKYLQKLIETGRLEKECQDTCFGIAKILIDKGFECLNGNQIKPFYDFVIGKLVIDKCGFCRDDIPWPEMFDALDNGGYCSTCARAHEEVMKEKAVEGKI